VIGTIHDRMDSKNYEYFKNNFIHRNLYLIFVKQNLSGFRSSKEFISAFSDVFKVETSINKLNPEFKRKLDIEIKSSLEKLVQMTPLVR
jgi:hypothetical protein